MVVCSWFPTFAGCCYFGARMRHAFPFYTAQTLQSWNKIRKSLLAANENRHDFHRLYFLQLNAFPYEHPLRLLLTVAGNGKPKHIHTHSSSKIDHSCQISYLPHPVSVAVFGKIFTFYLHFKIHSIAFYCTVRIYTNPIRATKGNVLCAPAPSAAGVDEAKCIWEAPTTHGKRELAPAEDK